MNIKQYNTYLVVHTTYLHKLKPERKKEERGWSTIRIIITKSVYL